MNLPRHAVSLILLVTALSAPALVYAQGPPFQVDDPVPSTSSTTSFTSLA